MSTMIDLTREIKDWEEAIYGEEVRSANSRAFQKIQSSVNEAIDDVSQSAQNINTTLS